MITLYDYELSSGCYKIRLLLSILGIPYQRRSVDFYPAAEHKDEALLALNPLGQLPVIEDDGVVLYESAAILTYLARRYAPESHWYPVDDAVALARINLWLSFAGALNSSASAARMGQLFGYPVDLPAAKRRAYGLFEVMDERLWMSERAQGGWLCDALDPTIADIDCFPYAALAEEGDIRLVDFPALRRWMDRVKRIPGFVVMSGVFPTSPGPTDRAPARFLAV